MEKSYKVNYLPTTDKSGSGVMGTFSRPMEGLDIAIELEALLIEREREGYAFRQMLESNRTDPVNGRFLSGIFVVFEKEKKKEES